MTLSDVIAGDEERVWEGVIRCEAPDCGQEYPIIDGVPILVRNVREFVEGSYLPLLRRHDLASQLESLIGDCLGPDHLFNRTRYYSSSYAADGYGRARDPDSSPGVLAQCRQSFGELAPEGGLLLDLGCGVGATTFALAGASDALCLGVDMNFDMLRLAQKALRSGRVEFPSRRYGVVYEEVRHTLECVDPERVDFWLCDALCLPFGESAASAILAMNLLDSVADPLGLLDEFVHVLAPEARCWITSPFDWSSAVTAYESWIGGHSQRGPCRGDPVATLTALLEMRGDLELHQVLEGVSWSTRVSASARMNYELYVAELRKPATPCAGGEIPVE